MNFRFRTPTRLKKDILLFYSGYCYYLTVRFECEFKRKRDFLVLESTLTKKEESMVFKILIQIVDYFLKGIFYSKKKITKK